MRLNADVGEDAEQIADGRQAALLALVDDANVACGGHAGNAASMRQTVAQCVALGVRVGAHPSTPDRASFGRAPIAAAHHDLEIVVREQLLQLRAVCDAAGVAIAHVKPHGALYHAVSDDDAWARVLARALRAAGVGVPVVLREGASTVDTLRSLGVQAIAEGFADRGTDEHGRLLPRGTPGAIIVDAAAAAAKARRLLATGAVSTLCVHGDTAGALAIARAVRDVIGPRR